MPKNDTQLMKEALQRQHEKVANSPVAARALLNELQLLTKSCSLKKSVTPLTAARRVSG